MKTNFFSIQVENSKKEVILEEIKQFLQNRQGWIHIVSLNPENIVVSEENGDFRKVLQEAEIKIFDGIGTYVAGRLLKVPIIERITGVDLMEMLLKESDLSRLKVLLIGGKEKIANKVVDCQSKKYPNITFFSLEGIKDIKNPKKEEEDQIFSIVIKERPHFVFVAFGSPYQELWLYKNKESFKGSICMGVGQSFDVLSNTISRAPKLLRIIGLEWLYRLIIQPWRWKRQIRLIMFIRLTMKEVIRKYLLRR